METDMRHQHTPSQRLRRQLSCLACRYSLFETRRLRSGLRDIVSIGSPRTTPQSVTSATTTPKAMASTSVLAARSFLMAGVWAIARLYALKPSIQTAFGRPLFAVLQAFCIHTASTSVDLQSSKSPMASCMPLIWTVLSRVFRMISTIMLR